MLKRRSGPKTKRGVGGVLHVKFSLKFKVNKKKVLIYNQLQSSHSLCWIAVVLSMNPIILLFLIPILAKARTRRDRLKATLVILTVLSQQQGRAKLANLRRCMARNTSDDSLVVHLLAALREEPTGVNDPHTSDIMKKIRKGNEIQFRRMFQVSHLVNLQVTK